jgi:FkbM family methyltransferase
MLNYQRVRFPEAPVLAKLRYGPRLWVRPNDPIGRAIFYDGCWEPPVIEHFAKSVQLGDVVLDVGANIGQFTLVAASKVGSNGKVIAIEAGIAAYTLLNKNIAENQFTQVQALHLAAWNEETTLHLGGVREDMLGWGQVQSNGSAQTETVQARRLDAVLAEMGHRTADVIKIDIEGAELQALQGITGLFEFKPPRLIYCELANNHADFNSEPSEVVNFFTTRGYTGYLLEDAGPVPLALSMFEKPVNVTAVFTREGRA